MISKFQIINRFRSWKALALILILPSCWTSNITDLADPAIWLSPVKEKHTSYGVFLFRNQFNLSSVPQALNIGVSADNRYKLYVNGVLIGNGPARGDLGNWYYETYNIQAHL